MRLAAVKEPATFRDSVSQWIGKTLPARWRDDFDTGSEDKLVELQKWWMERLAEAGLSAPMLPVEYGGAGLDFEHHLIIVDELARADTPPLDLYMVTLNHAPATLLEWGTPAQKSRYLPGTAAGEIWCQGFSEPNAGSDLASLRTKAVRDGREYVVNGQKIWSSFSRFARYCLLLARTGPAVPKREGISYFILDMQSPGVEVRPIRQITGNADFCEIFLTDVRVPTENLIGNEHEGWRVAQSTLSAERGLLAFERTERLWHHFGQFITDAVATKASWLSDVQWRRESISLFGQLQAERRLIRKLVQGATSPPMLPAVVKLSSTDLAQRIADFLVRIRGMGGQFYRPAFEQDFRVPLFDHFHTFGNTISAGSNEIMRNLISERALGMPK